MPLLYLRFRHGDESFYDVPLIDNAPRLRLIRYGSAGLMDQVPYDALEWAEAPGASPDSWTLYRRDRDTSEPAHPATQPSGGKETT